MNNDCRIKHPDRVPVIVKKAINSNLPDIDRNKYLVPKEFTVAHFMFILRKRLSIKSSQSIYLFLDGNYIPTSTMTFTELDKKYCPNRKDSIKMYFAEENTFG